MSKKNQNLKLGLIVTVVVMIVTVSALVLFKGQLFGGPQKEEAPIVDVEEPPKNLVVESEAKVHLELDEEQAEEAPAEEPVQEQE
ncbi:MAG: hypothetical protein LBR25_09245 [Erysipelotrichaceae bacterium]|jgi:hypothetical protein|nr:hypothetical protein [Erysipelotrichaceae bacterium]